MADVYLESGEAQTVGVAAPTLTGKFLPTIDTPYQVDGFGMITPWGAGDVARRLTSYGLVGVGSQPATSTDQIASILSGFAPAGDTININIEGIQGPIGVPGPKGDPGIAPFVIPGPTGASGIADTAVMFISSNFTITNNSPIAGKVAWSSCVVKYKGYSYQVVAGNTDLQYVYWDANSTPTQFHATAERADAIGIDRWPVVLNDSGTGYAAFIQRLFHAGWIVAGTITATEIAAYSLTADLYQELRQTYPFTADDSLDATHPFEIPFRIASEMTSIVSVKVSFRILPFRAYSTGAASGGGQTSGSGGAQTSGSGGAQTTSSGGGQTTSSGGGQTTTTYDYSYHSHSILPHSHDVSGSTNDTNCGGTTHSHSISTWYCGTTSEYGSSMGVNLGGHNHSVSDHYHSVSDHSHNVGSHTHTVSNHTHSVSDHIHSLTFGIYEEITAPTVHFHIDNGIGYGGASSDYTADQAEIDVTAQVSESGWKAIRFDSTARTRLWVAIECKIDVTA